MQFGGSRLNGEIPTMTNRKLNRLRRKYNALRRVNYGWTPRSWSEMLDCSIANSIGVREFLRAYYGIR